MKFQRELALAIRAVHAASRATAVVQSALAPTVDAISKVDKSPVTVADFAAQAIVSMYLSRDSVAANDAIIGEEEASALRSDRALGDRVVGVIASTMAGVADADSIQRDGVHYILNISIAWHLRLRRYWTLDPVDGTKGFLRKQQYAVCLALLEHNEVQVGVLACPNLPYAGGLGSGGVSEHSAGTLMWAVKGEGAFQTYQTSSARIHTDSVAPDSTGATQLPRLLESYESGHSNHAMSASVMRALGISDVPPLRVDSQCKYAALARGDGNIYLRVLKDPEYKEKIWDHASGSLIVTEAGGIVTDLFGDRLLFATSGTLSQNTGILATCGPQAFHDRILDAVQHDPSFAAYAEASALARAKM
ncbi:hypothetical protein BC828DRAFT_350229 [Blastocladiella britannica]|nr:hypothetical protein BC828DRAFT_350229 [Blastocladiella britannica]